MKRIATAVLLAVTTLTVSVTAAPAQADEPTCDVQPIIAGECVTQPVADYVLGQLDTIQSLERAGVALSDSLRAEQAAHQETRLLLAAANAEVVRLYAKVARKQQTIERLRAELRALRD